MRPSEFASVLFGEQPKGLIQLISLRPAWSRFPASPSGVDYYADGQSDVYVAVGLAHPRHPPRSPQRARANQVVTVAGLWLDVDIDGPGRRDPGVPDRACAIALARAIQTPTVTVDSGYGIHAWFLFEEPWTFTAREQREQMAAASEQWYALHRAYAVERGWGLGATHDLARVLRLPGTLNAKRGGRAPVQVVEFDGRRYPREHLLTLAATAGPIAPRPAGEQLQLGDGTPSDVPVADRLRALIENVPEFADTWRNQRADAAGWSMSEYDLAVASQLAAADWTNTDIAVAITLHRRRHDPNDPKAYRVDYLRRTIAKARERNDRDAAAAALRDLAGRGRAAA